MPVNPIYTSPKTEAHLRLVLGRIEKALSPTGGGVINDVEDDIAALEADVAELDGVVYVTKVADSAISAGQLVYPTSGTNVGLAVATSLTSAKPTGIALETVAMGADVRIQTVGIVSMSGLTANTTYFLSADTAGSMVSTPDATGNEFITVVGVAVSATEFRFNPLYPIQL